MNESHKVGRIELLYSNWYYTWINVPGHRATYSTLVVLLFRSYNTILTLLLQRTAMKIQFWLGIIALLIPIAFDSSFGKINHDTILMAIILFASAPSFSRSLSIYFLSATPAFVFSSAGRSGGNSKSGANSSPGRVADQTSSNDKPNNSASFGTALAGTLDSSVSHWPIKDLE